MAPQQLSSEFVKAVTARETGVVALWLLDINHEDLDEPIRIVNNTEDVVSGGKLYTAVGFELRPPGEREGTPREATIDIDNTSQWLTPTIRSLFGFIEITIKLAIASDPSASPPVYDLIEFEYMPLQLSSIESTETTVRGTLTYENLVHQPYPPDTFNPMEFPGLYNVPNYMSSGGPRGNPSGGRGRGIR